MRKGVLLLVLTSSILAVLYWQRSEEKNKITLSSIKQMCEKEKDWAAAILCFRGKLSGLVKRNGRSEVMGELASLYGSNQGNKECHDLAHVIGEVSVRGDSSAPLEGCSSVCGFGCFHGAALGYLKKADSKQLAQLDTLCSPYEAITYPGQDMTACRHGVGHGIAEYSMRDIYKAFVLCEGFATQIGRDECATGVFMEIYDAPTFGEQKREIPSDFVLFCESLPEWARAVCLNNSGAYTFHRTRESKEAIRVCLGLNKNESNTCMHALGADLYFNYSDSIDDVVSKCSSGGNSKSLECIEGAVSASFVHDTLGRVGEHICQASGVLKIACLSYLRNELDRLETER